MRAFVVPAVLRRLSVLAVLACSSFAFVGCDDGGSSADPDAGEDGERDASRPVDVDSAGDIHDHLEGKTLTMEGTAIPSHPFGLDERRNLGSNTQCYHRVSLEPSAGNWEVTDVFGTLNDAPNANDVGTCDRATSSSQLVVTSTQIQLENVTTSCFDVTVSFNAFTWEGRGKFSADGKTLSLELYYAGMATGHRCANGAVGSASVQVGPAPFTGNAVQVFTMD